MKCLTKNRGGSTLENITNNSKTGADAGGIKTEVASADVTGMAPGLVCTFVRYGNDVATEDTAVAVY